MYMLGVDVGSSFLKSSVLDLENMAVEDARIVPTPDFKDISGDRREIPIAVLAEAVKSLIDQAAAAFPLEGVVLSVQMHGFMLFRPDGSPVTDYISWQDMRAARPDSRGRDTADRIRALVPPELLGENGITLRNHHSLCPLYQWVLEEGLEDGVEFAMLGDALTRLITGRRVPIHPTVAASSGLYSLVKGDWNRPLIRALGLGKIDFPPVCEGREAVAHYSSSVGEIPVYAAVGDHQAAVLGTCVGDDHVIINIGTGGQISYIHNGLSFGEYETRPYFEGRTLRAFTQRPSGRSLNVLTDFVQDIGEKIFDRGQVTDGEIWKKINLLTQELEKDLDGVDSGLRCDLSFFDPTAGNGSISGIGGGNLRVGNLFFSVYASMAEEYAKSYRRLLPDGCGRAAGVVCTGGVIRKAPLLKKLLDRCFAVPCQMAPYGDDAMVGLLRLALWHSSGRPLCGAQESVCLKE